MGFLEHPGIALGTIFTLVLLSSLIVGLRMLRKKLLPDKEEKEQGLAKVELLLLKARLEEQMDDHGSFAEPRDSGP